MLVAVAVALGLMAVATACGGSDEAAVEPAVDPGEPADGGDSGAEARESIASEVTGSSDEPVVERPPDVQGPGLSDDQQAELDALVEVFLDDLSATSAQPVVELMGRSGELRYGPWLLDLVQLSMSNLLNRNAVDALAALTGAERTGQTFVDFARMGSLIETWEVDGGPGYRAWKTALFTRFDPEFGPFLDSVDDDPTFTRLRLGGVRRGGIPELNDPARISAQEARQWITDDEIVLGVDLDGEAVAYPFRIVGHHELVNDEVAGVPVALVYCTLCRTGLLFDRRVGDLTLDFQTSGLLANSNKVMVDRQTDTLWQHTEGSAFAGPLEGTVLEFLALETTSWAEWVAEHPDTEVIDIPGPIFFDDPERPPIAYPYEADGPYASYYASDQLLFPARQAPDTFPEKTEVIGIELAGTSLAVSIPELAGGPARFFPVGTAGVVIVPSSRGARVYDASASSLMRADLVAGDIVEVVEAGTDDVTLADGTGLPRYVAEQGFWFSWWERHPETSAWPLP